MFKAQRGVPEARRAIAEEVVERRGGEVEGEKLGLSPKRFFFFLLFSFYIICFDFIV